jgi:hypothetical protein
MAIGGFHPSTACKLQRAAISEQRIANVTLRKRVAKRKNILKISTIKHCYPVIWEGVRRTSSPGTQLMSRSQLPELQNFEFRSKDLAPGPGTYDVSVPSVTITVKRTWPAKMPCCRASSAASKKRWMTISENENNIRIFTSLLRFIHCMQPSIRCYTKIVHRVTFGCDSPHVQNRISKFPVDDLAAFIANCRRLLVVTGAGVSTDSGVPDYR